MSQGRLEIRTRERVDEVKNLKRADSRSRDLGSASGSIDTSESRPDREVTPLGARQDGTGEAHGRTTAGSSGRRSGRREALKRRKAQESIGPGAQRNCWCGGQRTSTRYQTLKSIADKGRDEHGRRVRNTATGVRLLSTRCPRPSRAEAATTTRGGRAPRGATASIEGKSSGGRTP